MNNKESLAVKEKNEDKIDYKQKLKQIILNIEEEDKNFLDDIFIFIRKYLSMGKILYKNHSKTFLQELTNLYTEKNIVIKDIYNIEISEFFFNFIENIENQDTPPEDIFSNIIKRFEADEGIDIFMDSLGFKIIDSWETSNEIDTKKLEKQIRNFDSLLTSLNSSKQKEKEKTLKLLRNKFFIENLLRVYNSLGLNQERIFFLKQIWELHHFNYYLASSSLLFSQLEGIISDFLVKTSIVKRKRGKFYLKDKKLQGLSDKLKLCITSFDEFESILDKYTKKNNLAGINTYNLTKKRNAILHGSSFKTNNEQDSAKLLLSLYLILLKMQACLQKQKNELKK